MTNRERFHAVMNFTPVDRLPMIEWAKWWDKTLQRWEGEGLKIPETPGLCESEAVARQFGLDLFMQNWIPPTTAQTPAPDHYGAGIVSSEADYERILPTLYPEHPLDTERMETCARLQERGEAVVWLTLGGFFWWPRVLFGIEPHLYAFYDEPDLMKRMNEDMLAYQLHVLECVKQYFIPDFITINEDMSYNNGPMLSEALFNEFLLPYYSRITPVLRSMGTRVFVDSDGDISKLLPWLRRGGVEGLLPLERQAGVDLPMLRKQYPDFLFIGHFDKMTMSRGEEAMRNEFERLLPVMRGGGYIPSVDHQTPPEVSLENYHIYLKLLREYVQRAAVEREEVRTTHA